MKTVHQPAENLIPHRASMQLIQELTKYAPESGESVCSILPDNIFLKQDQFLDPIVLVELLAQLSAAHSGYEAVIGEGQPKNGFLVGIKNFKISESAKPDDLLLLHIDKDTEFDQVTFLNGRVEKNNVTIAEGTLKVWEQENTGNDFELPGPSARSKAQKPAGRDNRFGTFKSVSLLNRAIIESMVKLDSGDIDNPTASLVFSNDFIGFDGHFPGSPILPGVIMLKCGLLLAEISLDQSLVLRSIRQAKFAKSIFPDEIINFKLNLAREKHDIKITITIDRQNEVCAKFTLMAEKVLNEESIA